MLKCLTCIDIIATLSNEKLTYSSALCSFFLKLTTSTSFLSHWLFFSNWDTFRAGNADESYPRIPYYVVTHPKVSLLCLRAKPEKCKDGNFS